MAHPQLHPMDVNKRTGEPFLRLPSPHENVILTPPRTEDIASIVRILNDPKVYKNLASPPVPYTETDASGFLSKLKPPSDAILKELEEASQEEPAGLKIVGGCPVRILREVQEDGSDIFLGDIGTRRCPFPGVLDSEEQTCLANANADLPVGDEGIVWCIACFLASSHHGRGIMPLALQTLVDKWMVPRMNARAIRAEVFIGNRASARIFEKCGFVQTEEIRHEIVTSSGETPLGTQVLWWRYTQAGNQ